MSITYALTKLTEYGLVKTCKIINDSVVTIVVTDGFSTKANKTFKFISDCLELFPDYPILETCITEDNLAILVLKK